MESYENVISKIAVGTVINFKEYILDRRERKRLSVDIREATVQEVIPANQPMSRDLLLKYYGEELDDIVYLQLSIVNCLRIVLIVDVGEDNQPIHKVISLNKDFYNASLQQLEILGINAPNVFDGQHNNPIMGFPVIT